MGRLFAALLQDVNGVPANPAIPAIPANPPLPISRLATLAGGPSFTGELEARIRAMASRWEYSPGDLAEALDAARLNPAGWFSCLVLDEQLEAKLQRAGMRFLP